MEVPIHHARVPFSSMTSILLQVCEGSHRLWRCNRERRHHMYTTVANYHVDGLKQRLLDQNRRVSQGMVFGEGELGESAGRFGDGNVGVVGEGELRG